MKGSTVFLIVAVVTLLIMWLVDNTPKPTGPTCEQRVTEIIHHGERYDGEFAARQRECRPD